MASVKLRCASTLLTMNKNALGNWAAQNSSLSNASASRARCRSRRFQQVSGKGAVVVIDEDELIADGLEIVLVIATGAMSGDTCLRPM